ncbi:MAG TPA: CHRD domain-containing protein [Candidatus Limnocylindria bacterium]|nr:CHRD domain-containing protein [Candidatus Limnocylindria bacterium]
MRRASLFLAIAALVAAPVAVFAAEPFSAELTVEAEVPPPTVPDGYTGSGSATATISDDGTSIDYEVTYDGLTGPPIASHIHFGATGVAGPVILPLAHGDSPFSGTLTEADFTPADGGPQTFAEALDAMRDGDTYVNVHTEENGPGEIRGQLMAADDGPDATPAPTPPDTHTHEVGAASDAGSLPVALLLALIGLAIVVAGLRRFHGRTV